MENISVAPTSCNHLNKNNVGYCIVCICKSRALRLVRKSMEVNKYERILLGTIWLKDLITSYDNEDNRTNFFYFSCNNNCIF